MEEEDGRKISSGIGGKLDPEECADLKEEGQR